MTPVSSNGGIVDPTMMMMNSNGISNHGTPIQQRSYLTLQGNQQGHVTLNPYHYYGGAPEDLHDGLAATLHLRDSVYMSPQLVRLTNTLRSKKKVCHQGAHPADNAGSQSADQASYDAKDEVVFRAVSPHGHVYWEIDPSRSGADRFIKPLEHIPNPGLDQEPLYNGSRQSSSRYSDNHPLISSNEGSTSVLVNPFADVQLLSAHQATTSSVTSSPLHHNLKPEHRFSSLRGFSQQFQNSYSSSPASKLFTNRSNSARAAKMRDIAKQIEHMRIIHAQTNKIDSTSGSTINTNTNSNSSGGSNSPTNSGIPEQLQQQVQIRDMKSIPVSVSSPSDHILAKIQNVMGAEDNGTGSVLLNRNSPKQRKV